MDKFELEAPEFGDLKAGDECPECDGKLVERYSRKFASEPFLGCTNWPHCEFTKNI